MRNGSRRNASSRTRSKAAYSSSVENISARIGPIQQMVGPFIAPRCPAGPVQPSNNSASGGLAAHESHQAVQAADSQTHAHHHYGPRLGDGAGDGAGDEQIRKVVGAKGVRIAEEPAP